jgi:hypothetical protein
MEPVFYRKARPMRTGPNYGSDVPDHRHDAERDHGG